MNKKTRVSQEQRKVLLEFMMEHPDVAQGRVAGAAGARKKDKILKQLAYQLNSSESGATKTPEKWWKCWQDWRSDTKAKALRIKKYWEGTGGGHMPAPLSKLEEILLEFSGVDPLTAARQDTDYGSDCAPETTIEFETKEVFNTIDDWCSRKNSISGSEDEESVVLDPDSELWGFFDKQPHNKAKCSMCDLQLRRDADTLYKHLKEKHSKISENLEYKDNEENFTEVIYLEEPLQQVKETNQENVLIEVQPKAKKAYKRRYSTREDFKYKETKNIDKGEGEIDNFGKYITGLLKGVPRNASAKLQMDIVTLIMNTKLSLQTAPDIDSEVGDRSKEFDPPDIGQENQENREKIDTTTTSSEFGEKQDAQPSKRPKRRISYREEYSYKVNLTDNECREIEHFGTYVTCLLKTVPQNRISAKLQMNIVNLIMTARLQALQKNPQVLTINGTIELDNTNTDSQVM